MADVAKTNVTLLGSWTEGGMANKRLAVLQVEVVITSAGSGASSNKIPASAFGLKKVEEVSPFIADDNSIAVVASPNYDGSEILLKAAGTNAPASYTDTFRATVKGQLKSAY